VSQLFTAPFELAYPYKRSLGPTLSVFFNGLRDGRLFGARTEEGRVLVPPTEYDPMTGRSTKDLVEVGPSGTVTNWCWVAQPRSDHPITDRPFAWATIQLEGADTGLLHVVAIDDASQMKLGMRVWPVWAEERVGTMRDIQWFQTKPPPDCSNQHTAAAPLTQIISPSRLCYQVTASELLREFLVALMDKKIVGSRCPVTGKVYVPPRGASPVTGQPMESDLVEVAQTGTVTTFCVVNIPFEGQRLKPPYVCAHVLLDGADVPLLHLVGGCDAAEVTMGMRVSAVWVDDAQMAPTLESIAYFQPTGETDVSMLDEVNPA